MIYRDHLKTAYLVMQRLRNVTQKVNQELESLEFVF